MEDTRGKAVVRQASVAELVTFTSVVSEISSMTGVTVCVAMDGEEREGHVIKCIILRKATYLEN